VTHLPDRGFAFAQEPGNAPMITERLSVKIIKDPKLESFADFTKKRKTFTMTTNIGARSQNNELMFEYNEN
jgi:hypothetical protein